MRKEYIGAIIISIVIIAFVVYQSSDEDDTINETFTLLNGQTATLSDYEGKGLLIDAMASWCEPCKIEMVHLYDIYQELGDQIEILSISVSPSTDDAQTINDFKSEVEQDNNLIFTWDFAIDNNLYIQEKYSISTIPTLIYLDSNGTEVKSWVGVVEASEIINTINSNYTSGESVDNNNILIDSLIKNPAFQLFIGAFVIFIIYSKLVPKKRSEIEQSEIEQSEMNE